MIGNTQAFLAAYRKTRNIKRAAEAAGIRPELHHRRMREGDPSFDPAYVAVFRQAQELIKRDRADEAAARAEEMEAQALAAEDELYKRAVHGWEEPVTFKGQLSHKPLFNDDGSLKLNIAGNVMFSEDIVTINKRSDALLQFFLRGARPDKYRERHQVEHTGSINIVERLQAGRKRIAKISDPDGTSNT